MQQQQQQQQQRASYSSATLAMRATTMKRGSLFRCLRRRGKSCNINKQDSSDHPAPSRSNGAATPGQEGDDDENKKKLSSQRLPNNNHQAEELEVLQQRGIGEEKQAKQQEETAIQQEQQHPVGASSSSSSSSSLLLATFLTRGDCPTDVLPRILAYAGPQTTCQLQHCSRFFYNVLQRQGTWRILCEELYKWKPGEPEPSCWKEHYRLNPCVPVDFKSIASAIETVSRTTAARRQQAMNGNNDNHSINNSSNDDDTSSSSSSSSSNHDHDDHATVEEIQSDVLTVWLRPGHRYFLPRAVTISTLHRTNQVRIETQQLLSLPEASLSIVLPQHHALSQQTVAASSVQDIAYAYYTPHHFSIPPPPAILVSSDNNCTYCGYPHNEPLFRVLRGTLVLRNVHLQHKSLGINIWNGNAAIQVQPVAVSDDLMPPMASAILHQVQIQSSSGRGIVAVGGGRLHVHDSYIHDCAATGVYLGGALSQATLTQTDIVGNGTGNRPCIIAGGDGIARGHSGVYVEQGTCELNDCSVSQNSASGICVLPALAMDLDNSMTAGDSPLTMRKTDVLANECNPLDFPQQQQQQQLGRRGGGETTRFNVFDPQHENSISPGGTPRPRSSILLRQV